MGILFSSLMGLVLFAMQLHAQTNQALNSSFEAAGSSASIAANWDPFYNGYSRVQLPSGNWDGAYALQLGNASGSPAMMRGAIQKLVLNQGSPVPVLVTARVRGQNIQNLSGDKYGAVLYAKVTYTNGTQNWCPMTDKTKNVGTFNWRYVGCNSATLPNGNLAIREVDFGALLGAVQGTAWFDSIRIAQYPQGSFQGAVTINPDDCFKEHRTFMFGATQSYGFKGTIACVSNYLSSGDPQYMNLQDLRDMANAGWEVMSHSVSHPDLTALSPVAMEDQLYWSKKYFTDNGFNVKSFALPFGGYNGFVLGTNYEKAYYSSVRKVERGYNSMGAFPFDIKIQELKSGTTHAEVNSWLNEARARKAWLVILLHKIRETCPDQFCTTPTVFNLTLQSIQSSALPVVTYEQGLNLVKSPR
jgi:hypothetical protein